MDSCLVYSLILKMRTTCSSETLVDSQRTTRPYIPEDTTLHNHCCENLRSCMIKAWFLELNGKSWLRIWSLPFQCTAYYSGIRWGSSKIEQKLEVSRWLNRESYRYLKNTSQMRCYSNDTRTLTHWWRLCIRPWSRMGNGGIAPPFLTSALSEGEWSDSFPGRFIPGIKPPVPIG
jgi:hypothetical protein